MSSNHRRSAMLAAAAFSLLQNFEQYWQVAGLAFLAVWCLSTLWLQSKLLVAHDETAMLDLRMDRVDALEVLLRDILTANITTTTISMNALGRSSSNSRSNHARIKSPLLWTSRESNQVVKTDKQGHVVHHSITHLTASDLQGLGSASGNGGGSDGNATATTTTLTVQQASVGRERLLELLQDAGVHDMEASVIAQMPLWEQVASLYYSDGSDGDGTTTTTTDRGPVIVGLETCHQFRATVPVTDASVAVAGLFNTGTNPAAMYLAANCVMPFNTKNDKTGRGMRWQVPWGKHMVADRKWTNTASHDARVNKTNVLPVVLVRDPYSWMQSMCQHPYAAHWEHSATHCPNLVTTTVQEGDDDDDDDGTVVSSVPVSINYPGGKAEWDSLVHLWSDWYNQYLTADYPRLMVRFEDFIFRPKEVVNEICTCAGAVAKQETFSYVVDSGKWGSSVHAGSSNMVTAMIKYGSDKNRLRSLTEKDLEFAANHLDSNLLRLFQYQIPSISAVTTTS